MWAVSGRLKPTEIGKNARKKCEKTCVSRMENDTESYFQEILGNYFGFSKKVERKTSKT